MTESEFDKKTKIVIISLLGLIALFMVSFIVYHCAVIGPDVDRTFVDKQGWTINEGEFHEKKDCWGETTYFIGKNQISETQTWLTRDHKSVIYMGNLQEGTNYSTYEKKYFFLFVPDNFYYIESKDCGN